MRHNEHHTYTAPTKFEVVRSAETPALRVIAKENLGELGVSKVVSISDRRVVREETTPLEYPSGTYSANVDSGVSQDTIYPHLNKLDLPPQSE